ncbi:hypothetical protein NHQ30_010380 [Ciborinia camelliae]|nr:hypothetical protein NHQ30_010380 [Ciborinia camelliae]
MANPTNNNQSTNQGAQSQAQTNAYTPQHTAMGQWTNQYQQTQYTEVNRAWSSNNGATQTQTQQSSASYPAASTASMSPMDRWAAETSQQAPWNPIGSVGTPSNNTGSEGSNSYGYHQQQAGDDWSICGNQSTN